MPCRRCFDHVTLHAFERTRTHFFTPTWTRWPWRIRSSVNCLHFRTATLAATRGDGADACARGASATTASSTAAASRPRPPAAAGYTRPTEALRLFAFTIRCFRVSHPRVKERTHHRAPAFHAQPEVSPHTASTPPQPPRVIDGPSRIGRPSGVQRSVDAPLDNQHYDGSGGGGRSGASGARVRQDVGCLGSLRCAGCSARSSTRSRCTATGRPDDASRSSGWANDERAARPVPLAGGEVSRVDAKAFAAAWQPGQLIVVSSRVGVSPAHLATCPEVKMTVPVRSRWRRRAVAGGCPGGGSMMLSERARVRGALASDGVLLRRQRSSVSRFLGSRGGRA